MLRASALVLVIAVATAHADPAAEKFFQDGRALLAEGNLADACDAFRKSNDLEPKVGTLLNLADCEEKRGRIAAAWERFLEARALARQLHDQRAGEADKRVAALLPRLPHLTINLGKDAQVEGLVVRRDGVEVPTSELGREIPIDPGKYQLAASAPGYKAWNRSIDIAESAHVIVEVPPLVAGADTQPTVIDLPLPGATIVTPSTHRGRFAIGVAGGVATWDSALFEVRAVVTVLHLGAGTLRFVPSAGYTAIQDGSTHPAGLLVEGRAEYLTPREGRFSLALGLGGGVMLASDVTRGFASARLTPTYSVGPVDVELGLGIALTYYGGFIASLGVDYFF
jgi:hypothetical protein